MPEAWQALSSSRMKAIASFRTRALARAGAFPSSDILPVFQWFENSRHPEFFERTAWSLSYLDGLARGVG